MERPNCPVCSAIFRCSTALKYHVKHKVCENPRLTKRCDICFRGFESLATLTRHRQKNACPPQHRRISSLTSGPKPSVAFTTKQFAEMNAELEEEECNYKSGVANISASLSSADRDAQTMRLRRKCSARRSVIRRSYGVHLRNSESFTQNAMVAYSGEVVHKSSAPRSTNEFEAITPLSDDSERSCSVGKYSRPGSNGTQQLPQPDQVLKSDNRPTMAQRHGAIIPRSRQPLHAERPISHPSASLARQDMVSTPSPWADMTRAASTPNPATTSQQPLAALVDTIFPAGEALHCYNNRIRQPLATTYSYSRTSLVAQQAASGLSAYSPQARSTLRFLLNEPI